MDKVFSFEVTIDGADWPPTIINQTTAGKAKAEYWRNVTDCYPDVPFTAVRCRKRGLPYSSPQFVHNAKYRGLPDVRCGQRVKVGPSFGTIVGHNSSANFDVLFDNDGSKYAGLKLNVHPSEVELIQEANNAR